MIKTDLPSLPKTAAEASDVSAPAFPLATGSGWVRVEDGLPEHGERVLATYVGVYGHRLVTYWFDGQRGRFGSLVEADERGPQPATHWHRLPALPNTETSQPRGQTHE